MNEFMKKLSLTKPIIQAPMAGGITKPRLASAVSNQGALGSLASGYLKPELLEQQIKEMFELTDAPFQINVFVPLGLEMPPEDGLKVERKHTVSESSKSIHTCARRVG